MITSPIPTLPTTIAPLLSRAQLPTDPEQGADGAVELGIADQLEAGPSCAAGRYFPMTKLERHGDSISRSGRQVAERLHEAEDAGEPAKL